MPAPESINLYMNQGVVVDLNTTSVFSGQFSTCAPIVLYNERDQRAGYYHLAGVANPGDFNQAQQQAIQHLLDHVQPTHAFILVGHGTGMTKNPYMTGHLKPVTDMVRLHDPNIQVQYDLTNFRVRNDPQGGLAPQDLQVERKARKQLPPGLVQENGAVRMTATNGLQIKLEDGRLCFDLQKRNSIEVSLNTPRDVGVLMAMTARPDCFVGNPDEGLHGWIRTGSHPQANRAPAAAVVERYMADVEHHRQQFRQLEHLPAVLANDHAPALDAPPAAEIPQEEGEDEDVDLLVDQMLAARRLPGAAATDEVDDPAVVAAPAATVEPEEPVEQEEPAEAMAENGWQAPQAGQGAAPPPAPLLGGHRQPTVREMLLGRHRPAPVHGPQNNPAPHHHQV